MGSYYSLSGPSAPVEIKKALLSTLHRSIATVRGIILQRGGSSSSLKPTWYISPSKWTFCPYVDLGGRDQIAAVSGASSEHPLVWSMID